MVASSWPEQHASAAVFAETADRKGYSEAIIEKDFWVCWVLKQLFSVDAFSKRLLFKGGTSLSKVFQAINRFSEDIDLAVDYVALGSREIETRGRKAYRNQNGRAFSMT